MDSVAFAGEDESQPSTSNGNTYLKLTRLLDGSGAVNHALIPRKLRSAMKKRGREFVTSPLLTSRKQHLVSTTVDTLRKNGAKKSKLNMKLGHITKDEEEVAETLFLLAGMFSDSQQNIDDEKPEIEPSATQEEGISINAAQEETRKIGSKITLGAAYPSNLVNSTAEEIKSQTLEARQPDLSPASTSRLPISRLSMNRSGEQDIHLDRVAASGFQDGKECSSIGDEYNGKFSAATRATNSETNRSCQSSRSRCFEDKFSSKKCTRVATESNKSWKRCSAHIYISRLIKVMQISDRKEGSPLKPTQPATCRDAELQSHVSSNGDTCLNAIDIDGAKKDMSEIQNGILLHKRPARDKQMASKTAVSSAKQEYDFLSLGTGLCGLDTGKSANGAGYFLNPPKQYHMPYMQSQNQSSMLFSLPQNGYSLSLHSHNSASTAQQVQLSQYQSSIVNSNLTARTAQLQTHYNTSGGGGGGGVPRLPDWKNGGIDSASVLNYAHSLFPHLHAALGSKYQQLSPSQQQHMLMNTSLPLSNIKRWHNLPLGFERNGDVFNPENMAQLQLPCNQHL